jgi:hypothetical protein
MTLRSGLSAAVAVLALSACGGTDPLSPPPVTYTVGGAVSGLSAAGLVLQLNGAASLAVTVNGPFVFGTGLESATAYTVAVLAQPSGQTCTVAHGTGTMADASVTSVAISCVAVLVPLFVDDFARPDQVGLGTTPNGLTWLITGPGYLAIAVQDQRYVGGSPYLNNNVSYAGILLREQPLRFGGLFSLVPSDTGGSNLPVVALLLSNDTVFTLKRMVHLIASRQGVALTWWAENNQDNAPAECEGSGSLAVPLADDGTAYPLYMTVRGNTVTVDKPDGTQLVCTDPHFSQLAGTLAIWELAYDRSAMDVPRWDKAEAFVEAPTQ